VSGVVYNDDNALTGGDAAIHLNNIDVGQHMTTAAHLRKSECVHNLSFRRLVDIFRGEVDNLVDVEIAGKLDFTHFG